MSSYQSPIRDLIVQLDDVARRHIAYPQVCDAMHHLRDHLSALARCEETNRRDAERNYGVAPHSYLPDRQAMGECRVCGHGPDHAAHVYRR